MKVLVVDDERLLRQMVERMLVSRGHTVVTATSREEAVEAFRAVSVPFDVVITDKDMPAKDEGKRFFETIKGNLGKTLVVMMSGAFEEADWEFARHHGIQLLPKPFERDGLIRAISNDVTKKAE